MTHRIATPENTPHTLRPLPYRADIGRDHVRKWELVNFLRAVDENHAAAMAAIRAGQFNLPPHRPIPSARSERLPEGE